MAMIHCKPATFSVSVHHGCHSSWRCGFYGNSSWVMSSVYLCLACLKMAGRGLAGSYRTHC